ncbi:MAG: hypothetical protein H6619_01335 [Deltaproteobacteria bacterium]|nr:hypothetical protein [Deltaproteobacteria bacterium]
MTRRKPIRDRVGVDSFGRRIPRCNFADIKAEIEDFHRIALLEEFEPVSVTDEIREVRKRPEAPKKEDSHTILHFREPNVVDFERRY